MKIFDIKIFDKTFTFTKSIRLDGKNYIAYEDKDNTYICQYEIDEDNDVKIIEVDENTINIVKAAMGL